MEEEQTETAADEKETEELARLPIVVLCFLQLLVPSSHLERVPDGFLVEMACHLCLGAEMLDELRLELGYFAQLSLCRLDCAQVLAQRFDECRGLLLKLLDLLGCEVRRCKVGLHRS